MSEKIVARHTITLEVRVEVEPQEDTEKWADLLERLDMEFLKDHPEVQLKSMAESLLVTTPFLIKSSLRVPITSIHSGLVVDWEDRF